VNDQVEFWRDSGGLIASVASSIVPPAGSFISIKGETWLVSRVTYAIDHSGAAYAERIMRANVELQATAQEEK
jgi:hypothetical protein